MAEEKVKARLKPGLSDVKGCGHGQAKAQLLPGCTRPSLSHLPPGVRPAGVVSPSSAHPPAACRFPPRRLFCDPRPVLICPIHFSASTGKLILRGGVSCQHPPLNNSDENRCSFSLQSCFPEPLSSHNHSTSSRHRSSAKPVRA